LWVKAEDLLPDEGQEVLVNLEGEICLAVFTDGRFIIAECHRIDYSHPDLLWSALITPHDSD
jgi:hypothetical protein